MTYPAGVDLTKEYRAMGSPLAKAMELAMEFAYRSCPFTYAKIRAADWVAILRRMNLAMEKEE